LTYLFHHPGLTHLFAAGAIGSGSNNLGGGDVDPITTATHGKLKGGLMGGTFSIEERRRIAGVRLGGVLNCGQGDKNFGPGPGVQSIKIGGDYIAIISPFYKFYLSLV
jgi:hypothetical protein